MRGILFQKQTLESGCIVSTSHKTNQDGYLRVRDWRFTGTGRKPLVMMHRAVWEEAFGEIPEGMEVDHKCRNMACFNVEHLQVLSRADHIIKTNTERYADRKAAARAYWEATGCTGTKLGKVFGVTFSTACGWVRDFKCVETIPEGSRAPGEDLDSPKRLAVGTTPTR